VAAIPLPSSSPGDNSSSRSSEDELDQARVNLDLARRSSDLMSRLFGSGAGRSDKQQLGLGSGCPPAATKHARWCRSDEQLRRGWRSSSGGP